MAIAQHKGIMGIVPSHLKMDQQIGDSPERMSKARVDVPVRWQSAPNHPSTHLAYITDQEAALLKKMDIHDSGVRHEDHIGPAGLPSYDDFGSGAGGYSSSGSSVGSGGGSNQSANAAMGSESPAQRDVSYTGGGGGRDASDAANAAARQQAERAQAEQAARDKAAADAANAQRIQAEKAAAEQQQRDAATKAAADKANADRIAAEKAAYEQQQQKDIMDATYKAAAGVTPTFVSTGSYTIDPGSFGMPSIFSKQYVAGLSGLGGLTAPPPGPLRSEQANVPPVDLPTRGVAAFNEFRPITPTEISTISPGTQSIPGYQAPQPYSGPHGKTMTDQERWAGGGVFNNLESLYNLPEGTLGKIMKTESRYGNDPAAYRLTSGPSGPFQISESTGKALGVVGSGFDYRLDPVESAAAAAKYSAQISDALRSTVGRTPTTGEIGLGYQQGIGGAKALLNNPNLSAKEALSKALNGDVEEAARRIKANGGDPDAPASQFTSQKISQYGGGQANPPALTAGLDKLMASLTGTTSDVVKAALSAPAKFADTLESLLTTPAQAQTPVQNVPVPSPVQRTYREAGSPADVYTGVPASGRQEDLGVTVSDGGAQTAAQAASSSPQTFGDWLSGLFDTSSRVKDLEASGKYAGLDKEEYARQFAGGDESKVQSRIVDFGQGPVVDYYTKGLDQALAEVVTGPFKAVGSLFGGGVENLPRGSAVRDKTFSDLFTQTEPSRGYGPYGDLTLEEYRKQYGGKDASSSSSTQKQASKDEEKKAEVPPEEEPVYTTGIDYATRRYGGNPLVAYDYSLLTRGLT